MKRFVALVLVLLSMVSVASAETIDLSGMTYDELVALKDQINLAIWNSSEWQEVEVPQGVWVIGEDIPVGKWTIKAADGMTSVVQWGNKLEDSGVSLSYMGSIHESERLYSTSYSYYHKGDTTEVTWDMKEGQYLIVSDGIVIFTPYSGKASLGFK